MKLTVKLPGGMAKGPGASRARVAWGVFTAVCARLALVLIGTHQALIWRPEITTPANGLLQIREGIRLLQLSLSPYQGSGCHAPPLVLTLWGPWATGLWYAVPNTICDLLAALVMWQLTVAVYSRRADSGASAWFTPAQLGLLYLWNPFTLLASIAGTSSSLENLMVLLAVYGGVVGDVPLAAFGVVAGAYVGLHPLLLMVPLTQLLSVGPEDTGEGCTTNLVREQLRGCNNAFEQIAPGRQWEAPQQQQQRQQEQQRPTGDQGEQQKEQPQQATGDGLQEQQQRPPAGRRCQEQEVAPAEGQQMQGKEVPVGDPSSSSSSSRKRRRPTVGLVLSLWLHMKLWGMCLLLLSDQVLRAHPQQQCWPRVVAWLQALMGGQPVAGVSPSLRSYFREGLGSCWMGQTYGFLLTVSDLTPNIGLFWYFFTEMFAAFQPFFKFVFHSMAAIFLVAMALRFGHRPLLLLFCQLVVNAMFKPYPSAADFVPWMALLPLLQQQLQVLQLGLFMVNSFLLLLVLGPAMWHQWINLDAANANFFYSITLLLGVWYTMLLVQMLHLTARVDQALAGKGPIKEKQQQQQAAAGAGAGEAAAEWS